MLMTDYIPFSIAIVLNHRVRNYSIKKFNNSILGILKSWLVSRLASTSVMWFNLDIVINIQIINQIFELGAYFLACTSLNRPLNYSKKKVFRMQHVPWDRCHFYIRLCKNEMIIK